MTARVTAAGTVQQHRRTGREEILCAAPTVAYNIYIIIYYYIYSRLAGPSRIHTHTHARVEKYTCVYGVVAAAQWPIRQLII